MHSSISPTNYPIFNLFDIWDMDTEVKNNPSHSPDKDAALQLVEVVSDTGVVIDVVPRAQIRAHNLRHRCTYVAVVTPAGDLVVHQRANWKDIYPGFWDICFGGVCDVSEEWENAALRELSEEAGVTGTPLKLLGSVNYDEQDARISGRVYLARHDGPITCPDGEVIAVDHIALCNLDSWLDKTEVCPDSASIALPLIRLHAGDYDG